MVEANPFYPRARRDFFLPIPDKLDGCICLTAGRRGGAVEVDSMTRRHSSLQSMLGSRSSRWFTPSLRRTARDESAPARPPGLARPHLPPWLASGYARTRIEAASLWTRTAPGSACVVFVVRSFVRHTLVLMQGPQIVVFNMKGRP